jgi:hypothetical protein
MMVVRAKHRCEADIGSNSRAERKNSFWRGGVILRHGAFPIVMPNMRNHSNSAARIRWSGPAIALFLVGFALLAGGCATSPERAAVVAEPLAPARLDTSRPLHVVVDSPITHPWIWSDRVAESFYNWIAKGFRAGGYNGGLVYVQSGREAPAGSQSLSISILQWRVRRDQSVEAVISGTYDAGDGVRREVGTVSGTSMRYFTSPNQLGLENAFDESAQAAARLLLERLTPAR